MRRRPVGQLERGAMAGSWKRMGRAFKSLEELGSDEADDLFLPVCDDRVNSGLVADVVSERMVDAKTE